MLGSVLIEEDLVVGVAVIDVGAIVVVVVGGEEVWALAAVAVVGVVVVGLADHRESLLSVTWVVLLLTMKWLVLVCLLLLLWEAVAVDSVELWLGWWKW